MAIGQSIVGSLEGRLSKALCPNQYAGMRMFCTQDHYKKIYGNNARHKRLQNRTAGCHKNITISNH